MTAYPSKQNYYQTSRETLKSEERESSEQEQGCMASGGGNRPTNLSFSVPPSFSSTSITSSLQTPDTNTFFLSSLSSGSAERDAPGEMLGNASPNAVGSQSFSSLEELLNVTGINSPDLGGAESSSRDGVDSLQQLAKEVESKQLEKSYSSSADFQPPATKRPRLELQTLPSVVQPHPLATQQQLPSNIRVQPLNLSSSSQPLLPPVTVSDPILGVTTVPNSSPLAPPSRTLPSNQAVSTAPIVPSLFSKVYQSPAVSQFQQQPHQLSETNSLSSMATNLPAPGPPDATAVVGSSHHSLINSSAPLSSSFSFTTTSNASLSQLSFPTLPSFSTSSLSTSSPKPHPSQFGYHPPLPTTTAITGSTSNVGTSAAVSMGNISFPRLPIEPSGQTPTSSASTTSAVSAHQFMPQVSTTSLSMQPQVQALGLGSLTSSSSSANSTNNSQLTTATSPVLSGSYPLIQMIQLYKQFHSRGDTQGMMKIKQQLNILIARQKILAAQNSLRAAQQSVGNLPPGASLSTTGATVSQNTNTTRLDQPQAISSSMSLNHPPHTLQSSQTAPPQTQTGGRLPVSSFSTTQLPMRPCNPQPLPATLSQQVNSTVLSSSQTASSFVPLNALQQSSAPMPAPSGMPTAVTSSATMSQTPFSIPPTVQAQAQAPPPTASAPKVVPSTAMSSQQQQTNRGQELVASQSLQQQIVKRLQTVIASLPDSQRPKSIPELREFVQKYSSLITQNSVLDLSVPGGSAGSQLSGKSATNSQTSASVVAPPRPGTSFSVTSASTKQSLSGGHIPSLLNSGTPQSTNSTRGTTLSHCQPATSSAAVVVPTGPSPQIKSATTQSPSAQVAEHFKSSLAALATSKATTVGGAVAAVLPSSNFPLSGGPMVQTKFVSGPSVSVASTVHAPVTSQLSHKMGSVTTTNPLPAPAAPLQTPPLPPPSTTPTTSFTGTSASATSTSSSGTPSHGGVSGIQPGVAMPLPPSLTLETLGVLCRLPESDLMKLKLPPALLSAIKFWKARQPLSKSITRASAATNRNNIPVVTAAGPPTTETGNSSTSTAQCQTQTTATATGQGLSPFLHKAGNAAASRNILHSMQASKASTSSQGTQSQPQQPLVIPNSAGFPPRSLHPFIPALPQTSLSQKPNSATPGTHKHQTRYKTKVEQQKVETERLQALAKALQSSEEARIAFRFSAHLDKMHTQLLGPDTVTPFHSQHDILARLLPYHVYAEPEPPAAAVEKADAVFESVAQVLLSRSRGLMSRFQQLNSKTDAEGGPEQLAMKMQLEKLFIEGEQERIRQENIEKQQAEQVAADLSLMADGVDAFEPDFSLGDAFYPLLDMSDRGIT